MTIEGEVQAAIRLAIGKVRHARLFRNNRGLLWGGRVLHHDGSTVTLVAAQRIECGLVNGASDLIGWTSVVITPDMVGRTVAVLTAAEVKPLSNLKRHKPSADQLNFIDAVNAAGGIAGVVRSPEDALRLVRAI